MREGMPRTGMKLFCNLYRNGIQLETVSKKLKQKYNAKTFRSEPVVITIGAYCKYLIVEFTTFSYYFLEDETY